LRGKGWPGLHLTSGVRAECLDEELPKEAREQRHVFPGSLASLTCSDFLDDREVRAIRDDQVVEALTNAPLRFARLPVDLFGGELTERASRLVGDQAALREYGR
jgi:hypothetical protein